MAKNRVKKRTHVKPPTEAETSGSGPKTPKSFVLRSGRVGKSLQNLVTDVRQVMEPNTATKLRERKKNKLRDFLSMAGPLNVSHMMLFGQTDRGANLRLAKTPRGPTFTFRVSQYTLVKDLINIAVNGVGKDAPVTKGLEYLTPPLLVLNNFNAVPSTAPSPSADGEDGEKLPKHDGKHLKLMTSMLQNLFPAINIKRMNLKDARRVVMFNYNEESGKVEFRHYFITVKAVGISKSVKKVLSTQKHIPDLSKFDDIADFIENEGYASEVSDNEEVVSLPQNYIGKNNKKSDARAIVLKELGPRMDLDLLKIEDGFCDGAVLFHAFESKTAEEIRALEKAKQKKRQEKLKRKREQEKNVKAKKEAREEAKNKKKAKRTEVVGGDDEQSGNESGNEGNDEDSDEGLQVVGEKLFESESEESAGDADEKMPYDPEFDEYFENDDNEEEELFDDDEEEEEDLSNESEQE